MKNDRLLELDVFRGFAALVVVLFHYTTKNEEIFHYNIMNDTLFKYGYLGVHLFFIISGFVIFMTINNVKTGKEFIYKRFIRLYPTFWLCVLMTFFVTKIAGLERFERTYTELFLNFTMIPSLLKTRLIDGAYWSLQYELIFYGFILVIYKMNLLKKIEILSMVWIILSLALIYFSKMNLSINYFITVLRVITLADYSFLFIAGINFYRIFKEESKLTNHLLILVCLISIFFIYTYSESFIISSFFLLFYLFVNKKLIFIRSLKPLVFLGSISYSLYLIHQFIGLVFMNKLILLGFDNGIILVFITIAISIFLSWIVTNYFEKLIHMKFSYKKLENFLTVK